MNFELYDLGIFKMQNEEYLLLRMMMSSIVHMYCIKLSGLNSNLLNLCYSISVD